MAQFQRYEQILARMVARVVSRAGLTDLTDASVVKHILAALAREIDDGNFQAAQLLSSFDLLEARGDDLDARAAEIQPRRLQRYRPQRAVGYVVFSRATNTGMTATVPVGTLVSTADNVRFRTTQLGTVSNTSSEQISGHGTGRDTNLVPIIAMEPGTSGNVGASVIRRMAGRPPGFSEVVNVSACTRGRDEELDAAFLARVLTYVGSLASGVDAAYLQAAQGVTDPVTGRSVEFAHVAASPLTPGVATVYVDDGAGTAESFAMAAPSGTGGAISAPVSTVQTFTLSSAVARAELVGRSITIAGGNVANNGTFVIASVIGSDQVTYVNATGVVEASFAGTYSISGEELTSGLLGPPANTAVGGEENLYLRHAPVRLSSSFTLTSSTRGALAQGTDYLLNPATGLVFFQPALSNGEEVEARYDYYTGLIAEVHRNLYGDPNDTINYPNLVAAGSTVLVRAPVVVPLSIELSLSLAAGADAARVYTDVETVLSSYVNQLGIGVDVVLTELIAAVMSVLDVVDVTFLTPTTNVVIQDDQISRTTLVDIDIR